MIRAAKALVGALAVGAGALAAAGTAAVAAVLGRRDDRFFPTRFGAAYVFTVKDPSGRLMRVLSVGGGWQSMMYLDDPNEPAAAYVAGFDLLLDGAVAVGGRTPRSVLMIGGAGFAWPRHAVAKDPDVAVTAVEVDPAVVAIAQKEFHLGSSVERAGTTAAGEPRLHVVVDDGLDYLARRAEGDAAPFDAIVNDAYAGMAAPEGLMGPAGLALAKDNLAPDGLYLVNVVADAEDPAPVIAARDALRGAFTSVVDVPCPDPMAGLENHVLVASDAPLAVPGSFEI